MAKFWLLGLVVVVAAVLALGGERGQAAGPKIGVGACTGAGSCQNLLPDAVIEANACTGPNSCNGLLSPTYIGAGACTAKASCNNAGGFIGAGSCIGEGACEFVGHYYWECMGDEFGSWCSPSAGGSTIGAGSCIGNYACRQVGSYGSSTIGAGSCIGAAACTLAGIDGYSSIGTGACKGANACREAGADAGRATVGTGSCTGEGTPCSNIGQGGNASIGDNTCTGTSACYGSGTSGYFAAGPWACSGTNACTSGGANGGAASVGSGGCTNGTDAPCFALGQSGWAEVGSSACQGDQACYETGASGGRSTISAGACLAQASGTPVCYRAGYQGTSTIGESSCQGSKSCQQAGMAGTTSSIGNYSCIGAERCLSNTGTLGNCVQDFMTPLSCIKPRTGFTTSGLGPLESLGLLQILGLVLYGVPGFVLFRVIQKRGQSMAWLALALVPVIGPVVGFFVIRKSGTVYHDGDVIFRQGDASDFCYVVRGGEVVLTREANGVTTELERAGVGGVIGEMGVLLRAPRSATATASGTVWLSALSAGDLLEPSEDGAEHPAAMVARALSRRLQVMNERADGVPAGD